MLTLVVLAAGLGSRFGGLKQLAPVGPTGEAFLDYAIVDATAAGTSRVVVVVRSSIEAEVRDHVTARHPDLDVAYVCQDQHGPPRPRPWGTAHAAVAAAPFVSGPFMICNADDYYGPSAYAALARRLVSCGANSAHLVGYRLGPTLPEGQPVSRGVCSLDGERLQAVVEHHGVSNSRGTITASHPRVTLQADAVVSMNLWGLPVAAVELLASGFERFLQAHGHESEVEYLLPSVINELLVGGLLSVDVVLSDERWVGLTHSDDLATARRRLASLRPA